jgi:hypothetical protein
MVSPTCPARKPADPAATTLPANTPRLSCAEMSVAETTSHAGAVLFTVSPKGRGRYSVSAQGRIIVESARCPLLFGGQGSRRPGL